jgi:hypothetical protein
MRSEERETRKCVSKGLSRSLMQNNVAISSVAEYRPTQCDNVALSPKGKCDTNIKMKKQFFFQKSQ